MELEDRIKNINKLNKEGIELTSSKEPDRYINSKKLHEIAAGIAKEIIESFPDYNAYSEACIAYDLRQMGQDRNFVLSFLENTLKTTENEFKSDKFTKSETFFGRARIKEEIGLVIRYNPIKDNAINDLKNGISVLENSVNLYEKALDNSDYEIVEKSEIKNRLFRTTGIISTVYSDLSEIVSDDEREKYQNESIDYAQKELKLRLENGETSGFGLMNAYHTLGEAQSKVGNKDEAIYKRGIENIEKAKQLAEKEGRNMVSSVLKLGLAWAEFMKYPEKKPGKHYEKIGTYFHEVLEDQKTPAKWNPAIKDKLKEKMFTLGNYLGKGSLIMLEKMYKS